MTKRHVGQDDPGVDDRFDADIDGPSRPMYFKGDVRHEMSPLMVAMLDAVQEMQQNPTASSLYKLISTTIEGSRRDNGLIWTEIVAVCEEATGELCESPKKLKKYTGHNVKKPGRFFSQLEKDELFTYSFSSMTFRCVERIAASCGVTVKYMEPGTKEYRTYGCCCCRRVK